ncbi:MAG: hypothetical protein JJT90_09620 [Ectothiorhodospiraceae bacterium]|nr:hypothetical protein [Ectothiorhodospiraceae bacterium]
MRINPARLSLRIALACSLVASPLLADEAARASVPSDDCDTLRAVYQRLAADEAAAEARAQLARTILLLPDCVSGQGRLQRARTLDGVDVFQAGRLQDLFQDTEQGR